MHKNVMRSETALLYHPTENDPVFESSTNLFKRVFQIPSSTGKLETNS